jgi:hypothetical protein
LHSLFVDLVIVDLGWSLSPVKEGLITLSNGDHCDIWNWVIVHSRIVIVDVVNQAGQLSISDNHLQSNAGLFGGGSSELEIASFETTIEHLDS